MAGLRDDHGRAAMIRITVCEAAFEAIANTLLRGSAAIELRSTRAASERDLD
jgi:hypothetical protein